MPSNLNKWTRFAIAACRSLLNIGQSSDNSQSALSSIPLDDHEQIFQVAAGHIKRSADNGIFQWKHSDMAVDVIARGNLVLKSFKMDDVPRCSIARSDSTVVTKTGNHNSDETGIVFQRVFNLRTDFWKGRSQEIVVFAKCGGTQEDFLSMLQSVVKDFCAGGNPSAFRGNLILIISLNDVKVGKKDTPNWKLDNSREIVKILRKMPLGTVSIIGPGTERNWSYDPGTWEPIAGRYISVLLESGHPIYNPEFVYGTMQMNRGFGTSKKTKITTYWDDIHFSETQPNYDGLVRLVADAISLTQFFGNLADVAATEGHVLGGSLCFPSDEVFGATTIVHEQSVSDNRTGKPSASINEVPDKLQTVKEESDDIPPEAAAA